MNKSRIAHLIYSRMVGGSEMVAANICAHLDREYYDPVVLFLYPESGSMEAVLSEMNIPHYGIDLTRWNKPFRRFFLPKTLNRLGVDILHVHHVSLYSTIAPYLHGTGVQGVVVTEHAKYSISRSERLQRASRQAVEQADYFTVISKNLHDFFVHTIGVSQDRLQIIYNGVDTERFSPTVQPGKGINIPTEGFQGTVFISVGRLAEAKDHITLFRAARMLIEKGYQFCIVVVGDGELMETLQEAQKDLGLLDHVFLIGARTDVPDLLQQADIFILSSKREGLPMVLLEAMSTALPVIATNVGGIPEIIKNEENGLLIQSQDEKEMATAMEQLIVDKQLAKQLGTGARQTAVEQYSLDTISNQYSILYNNILSSGS